MLPTKLIGLESLVALNLGGTLYCSLSPTHQSPLPDSREPQSSGLPKNAHSGLFLGSRHQAGNALASRHEWRGAAALQKTTFKGLGVSNAHWKDESVQTESVPAEFSELSILTEKFSSVLHHLNRKAYSASSDSSALSDPSPPILWKILGRLDYSPALFNLGVWYQRRSQELIGDDTNARSSCLRKAELSYRRAVQADGHPTAAYNLACILIASNREEIKTKSRTYSVNDLMEMAANKR
ncbi:hypothetical protein CRM22_003942 [Opisthorchis felineus]|uniref:Uncharacterized protein n=1 Tax=Opisthorchis felineus TaxID=147828 RepID=A0A4S2M3X9_OPIFE|nr:hypothetical protein CRM22_003942 [Opisthorchis felineus]TGZ69080.1 hypothetical protein CRM22_003942 [Opisthorchis felineus]